MVYINNNNKKKRTCKIVDFAIPADRRVGLNESEKKDKYLDLAREVEKTVKDESDNYTNCNWCSWYSHQKIYKATRGDHPIYCIIKMSQNTEKSPGDLRRRAVIQNSVKD